jgi:hypothetical protein
MTTALNDMLVFGALWLVVVLSVGSLFFHGAWNTIADHVHGVKHARDWKDAVYLYFSIIFLTTIVPLANAAYLRCRGCVNYIIEGDVVSITQ